MKSNKRGWLEIITGEFCRIGLFFLSNDCHDNAATFELLIAIVFIFWSANLEITKMYENMTWPDENKQHISGSHHTHTV